jgi:dTDP-glucose 4,6-dehydratase
VANDVISGVLLVLAWDSFDILASIVASRLLVSGGLGFIGSEFIRRAAARGEYVVNVDICTYAGDPRRLACVAGAVETIRADVADQAFTNLVVRSRPTVIVHFAAESHVTRSESAPERFFQTNVEGTRRVLDAAEQAGTELVVHVSTDEVYGPCTAEPFREQDKLEGEGAATSAYARSKALADDLALSRSHRLGVIVARPTNCFGQWQHPEKAIPRWTVRALRGRPLPVWGGGGQVRDWMHVEDVCAALDVLVERGVRGQAYNVSPQGPPRSNLDVARLVAAAAGREADAVVLADYDRPGHDVRYAVDSSRLRSLGWSCRRDFEDALESTVGWYREHPEWWAQLEPEAEAIYRDD